MRAGIALGSNVGDRLDHLREGKDRIVAIHEGGDPPLISAIYETDPVDCAPGTVTFLNAVLEIESSLDPFALLDRNQQIETDLGRPLVREKNSPRTLDVDLLYFGEQIIDNERLILPHPRALERQFVLVPLGDIRPDLAWPGTTQLVSDSLERLTMTATAPAPILFRRKW